MIDGGFRVTLNQECTSYHGNLVRQARVNTGTTVALPNAVIIPDQVTASFASDSTVNWVTIAGQVSGRHPHNRAGWTYRRGDLEPASAEVQRLVDAVQIVQFEF